MRRKKRKTRRRRITRRRRTRRRITRRRRTRRRTRRKRGSGNIECPKCKKQFKQNERALWSTCPHCKQRITKKDIQKKIREYGFESVERAGADIHRDTSQQWAPRTRREKWQDAKAGTVTGVVKGISRAHKFLWGIKGKKKRRAPTNEDHRTKKQQGTRKRDKVKDKVKKLLRKKSTAIIMPPGKNVELPPPVGTLTLIRKTPSGRRFGSLIPQETVRGRYHNTPDPPPREGLENWEMVSPAVKHTSHAATNNPNWEDVVGNNNNGNRFI